MIFFDQDLPPSVDFAPNILLCLSRRSSHTAKALSPSPAKAIRFSLATVSISLTLAPCDHLPDSSFANEKMSPILLQAVTVKPFVVNAICGPLVCEAASLGRTEIKAGLEKVFPWLD